jgi:hypothetical protein
MNLRIQVKLAIEMCREQSLMDIPIDSAPALPFSVSMIPTNYPQPKQLQLWIVGF